MTNRISEWLRRVSTGWVALAALTIFLLFSALVLPRQSATAGEVAQGAGSPDTSLYYSADDLYQMAEAYGEQGRKAYIRARFTFDLVWPLVYTLFLVTAISWLFSKAFAPDSWWQWANLTPVLGALFDYLENISTSLVMGRYPNPTAVIDVLAPVFTLLKWAFLAASFALLLAGMAIAARQWMKERGTE